jgi:hypothetical protein
MAAPYVAAPFTSGASLALIGAGAGAGSALVGGGGVKEALLGAGMGAIPGATSALSKPAQIGVQAGTNAGAGLIPTNPSNIDVNAAINGLTPNPMAASTAQPSFFSSIARNPEVLKTASSAIAAATQAAGKNRSSLRDAQIASYVASGGGPSPASSRLRTRASDLEEELLNRLTPSFWERFGTYAAPAAAIYASTLPTRR